MHVQSLMPTHQFGSVRPWSVWSSRSAKKSSTEAPMLTGGTSRWLLLAARIRRSCIDQVRIDIRRRVHGRRIRTFSSILASGPPPPSPLPKTRRAVDVDSKFYTNAGIRFHQRYTKSSRAYFVVRHTLVHVTHRCLGSVGI
jgi:hypothetical protein